MIFEYNFKKTLASILVNFGLCSDRSAKNFLLKNQILVNGIKITDRKFLVAKTDSISVNGEKLVQNEDVYLILNKPAGFVCSTVSDSHKTVYELVPPEILDYCRKTKGLSPLHTVGRLDCDTEGLLILTTDGAFSHFYADPKNRIQKKYFVRLKEKVSEEKQLEYKKNAESGLILPAEKKAGEEKADSAMIEFLSENECEITVTEGKFHEVKRIFRSLGNEVIYLKRIQFGDFKLES